MADWHCKQIPNKQQPIVVCERDALTVEIGRLRAAIDALLTDIDGDHRPEWSSDDAEAAGKKPWCCAWCGAADGDWPCVHRRALDDLKEARRG